jgi:cytochrome c
MRTRRTADACAPIPSSATDSGAIVRRHVLFAASWCCVNVAIAQSPPYASVQPILAKHNCLACHAVDKKVVGPGYLEVAAKYKGNANARAYLAQKIKAGGSGVWGPVPMPPNPGITDPEIKTVLDWTLSGAPTK